MVNAASSLERARREIDSSTHQSQNRGIVLVPVKAFGLAKARLSPALEPHQRAHLAELMAARVIAVHEVTPVAVACDDAAVATWAERLGARVVWCQDQDLNGAITTGYAQLCAAGFESIAIAHADLPRIQSLRPLLGWPGVTLVPDRHRQGTNVMVVPAGLDFDFQYGTNSYPLHMAEAVRHQRGLRIVHDPALGWDVDTAEDLDENVRQMLRSNSSDRA